MSSEELQSIVTNSSRLELQHLHSAATAELERRRRLREVIAGAFEVVPGDSRFCVRRLEVAEHVARTLGEPVIDTAFFLDVQRAAEALGMVPVKNGNRSLYRCVRRRDQDEAQALAASKAHRHDPRTDRGRALDSTTERSTPLPCW